MTTVCLMEQCRQEALQSRLSSEPLLHARLSSTAVTSGAGNMAAPQGRNLRAHQKLRLSLKHGASVQEIVSYMTSLSDSLWHCLITGAPDATWVPGTVALEQCYRMGREIGRGHFGVVRLCWDKTTNEVLACKSILKTSIKTKEDVNELCTEVTSMLRLQNSASYGSHVLLRLHEVLEDSHAVHLVMDYCSGGDLFDHVALRKHLSEKEAAHVLKQVVAGVLCMHREGLVHRDLKPENILLLKATTGGGREGKPEIRVADFGLSADVTSDRKPAGVVGSPFYMAPEVIRRQPQTCAVDVWSLGVVLYTCLSGCLPFWGKGKQQVFEAVLEGKPQFVKRPWPLVSPEAKRLIRALLHQDPAKRLLLRDVLKDPWMVKHCPELRYQQPQQQLSRFSQRQQQQQLQQQQQQQHSPLFRYPSSPVPGCLVSTGTPLAHQRQEQLPQVSSGAHWYTTKQSKVHPLPCPKATPRISIEVPEEEESAFMTPCEELPSLVDPPLGTAKQALEDGELGESGVAGASKSEPPGSAPGVTPGSSRSALGRILQSFVREEAMERAAMDLHALPSPPVVSTPEVLSPLASPLPSHLRRMAPAVSLSQPFASMYFSAAAASPQGRLAPICDSRGVAADAGDDDEDWPHLPPLSLEDTTGAEMQ